MNKVYILYLFITLSTIIINCANSNPISTSSATGTSSNSTSNSLLYTSCNASKALTSNSQVVSLCVSYTGTNYSTNTAVFSDCNTYSGLAGSGCTLTSASNLCTISTAGFERTVYYYTIDTSTNTHCQSLSGVYQ